MMSRSGVTERFLYIEVDMEQFREPLPEEIIHLPELSCVCMKTDHSDIEQAAFLFPDLFSREYDRIVMETELFPDHYYFHTRIMKSDAPCRTAGHKPRHS